MPTHTLRGSLLGRTIFVAALCSLPSAARAQSSGERAPPDWSVTASAGGYVRGNRTSVIDWLRTNGYGVTDPGACGFNPILQKVCDDPTGYPRAAHSGFVGWTLGVHHTMTRRVALEVDVASEQSGTVTGRCNDDANPRDTRCTDRFMILDIGGTSYAALAIVNGSHVHLGAGPAVLFADWRMQPAHLAGMWFDATLGGKTRPFFARVQYRIYKSAGYAPERQFTVFHPSTLFIGGGFSISPNNGAD